MPFRHQLVKGWGYAGFMRYRRLTAHVGNTAFWAMRWSAGQKKMNPDGARGD